MFAIDNTRPVIENLAINYPKATARAHDNLGTIAEMAFSVDDGPWQLGTTADGLFDDQTEDLRVDIPAGPRRAARTRSRCASPIRPATSVRRRPRSS